MGGRAKRKPVRKQAEAAVNKNKNSDLASHTAASAKSEEVDVPHVPSKQRKKRKLNDENSEVVDLTDLPGPSAVPTSSASGPNTEVQMRSTRSRRAAAPQAADVLPAWHNLKGSKRLQAELRYMHKQIASGQAPQISDVTTVGDDLSKWRFKVKDFDTDCEAGSDLNSDLAQLRARHGQDHLLMEATFPSNYPEAPFFLRMITPRCCWYTGHVTAGGSICIEMLTQSGSRNAWSSAMCFESVMNTVILNMLHCDVYFVQTATGPGGMSGPLRVDLNGSFCHSPMAAYSDGEAQAAFQRMLAHHRRNGW